MSYAPTSRARCRGCKRRVERGELRLVVTAFVQPLRSTCFVRCCRCIDGSFACAVLAVYTQAAHVPAEGNVDYMEAEAVRARLDAMARK